MIPDSIVEEVRAIRDAIAEEHDYDINAIFQTPPPRPASADAVLDGVAGALFPTLVAALRPGGRYCIVGAAGGGEVAFDAWSLLDGRVLTGYSTEDLDGDALRIATRELLGLWLPPPPTKVLPLAEAARGRGPDL